MKYISTIFSLVLLITFASTLTAQVKIAQDSSKKLGKHTLEEWQTVIDTSWGEGISTDSKLALFDNVRNIIDLNFSCFQGLPENILDSLTQKYRPEIEAGVSYGRFVAIMNHFGMAFEESHLWVYNKEVNSNTPLNAGVPLFVIGAWTDNSHFGATLTPLADGTLLVIKTLPNHPLGLVPGDIVLGYDGIPWKILYKEILTTQFPFFAGTPYCTSEKAFSHDLLKNAGMNWHLFDTLDVVKYNNGDTLHFPTSELTGQNGNIAGNEQLKVPGVSFPDINWQGVFDFDIWNLRNYVGWGIIKDTNIGYIYVYAWFTPGQAPGSNISEEFYNAINKLMNYYKVEGLILDDRFCFGGGQWDTEDKGFSLLFNSYIETVAYDKRCGSDHFQLCPHPQWDASRLAIPGNPTTLFDRPIAVLTGPGAVSHGDIIALKMTFHPMAHLFGKSTSGAFSGVGPTRYPGVGWFMFNADANAYLVSNPGKYLSGIESHVDEEVWLTQEDVAKREDTVVKRALEWIQNLAHAHDVTANKTYAKPGTDSIIVTAQVENPNQHQLTLTADLHNLDDVFIDSLKLFDDGQHEDGAAGDNIWGNVYTPLEEQSITVSVETKDIINKTSRILPKVTWFTTSGPIKLSDCQITSSDTIPNAGDSIAFRFELHNWGLQSTASNITTKIIPLDTCASLRSTTVANYGDMAPGETVLGNRSQYIQFSEKCNDGYQAQFVMEISSNGYHFWSDTFEIEVVSTIERYGDLIPNSFSLHQNFPNPFNPSTTIEFSIPKTKFVTLKIFNLLGQEVVTLVSDKLNPGNYTFQFDGMNLASGIYYYQLVAGEYREVKKMILLK